MIRSKWLMRDIGLNRGGHGILWIWKEFFVTFSAAVLQGEGVLDGFTWTREMSGIFRFNLAMFGLVCFCPILLFRQKL